MSNPKRVADFRVTHVCGPRPRRCAGQMTLGTAPMMVLGRCSRQRVSRIGGRTRLPKQRLQAIFFPERPCRWLASQATPSGNQIPNSSTRCGDYAIRLTSRCRRTYAGAQFVAVAFDSSPRRPTRITRTGDTRRRRRAVIPSSLCTTAGLQSAFQDVDAVIDYAQSLPFADASRITLVGMSRGGFLSIAYAAEGRERARVRSVINFVGGWVAQAEDQCPAL
jgi:hypothetical protein